ncbi:MAG: hypothetical protein JWO80_3839 [Bryobacterales bacterium]|nr:hypothetical protein [Bryobacterales bacterium]
MKESAQNSGESLLSGKRLHAARELKRAFLKRVFEPRDKLAAKDATEHLHGQKKRISRMNPSPVIM